MSFIFRFFNFVSLREHTLILEAKTQLEKDIKLLDNIMKFNTEMTKQAIQQHEKNAVEANVKMDSALNALKDLISGVERLGHRTPHLIELDRAKALLERIKS